MKYVVVEYVTSPIHPYMPNEILFRHKNIETGELSLGAWKTRELAEKVVDKLNK